MLQQGLPLKDKRVAILVEGGFEDRELTGPLEALRAAGAQVTLVGPIARAPFRGKRGDARVTSDIAAGAARKPDDVPQFSEAIIRALIRVRRETSSRQV